jgi:hypothetical protein
VEHRLVSALMVVSNIEDIYSDKWPLILGIEAQNFCDSLDFKAIFNPSSSLS